MQCINMVYRVQMLGTDLTQPYQVLLLVADYLILEQVVVENFLALVLRERAWDRTRHSSTPSPTEAPLSCFITTRVQITLQAVAQTQDMRFHIAL